MTADRLVNVFTLVLENTSPSPPMGVKYGNGLSVKVVESLRMLKPRMEKFQVM